MPKYTKEQLEAQYKKLPDALKDALFSVDVASKIYGIGRKFGLTIEKTGFAAEETGYVVLGLTQPQDFAQLLGERLEVKIDEAKEIASAINRQIFFPLRESLKRAHQIEINEEEIQTPAGPLPPSKPTPPPWPKPTPPLAPISTPRSPLPPLSLKPLAEKPTTPTPTPPFKSPAEKTALLLSPLSTTPKIEPIDLRFQQKTKSPAPPPRPEPMGGSIFGAPSIVNLAPKPHPPSKPPVEKPSIPKPITGYDPYKEPIE